MSPRNFTQTSKPLDLIRPLHTITMSTIYVNPLHPPIPSALQSPFNTLSGAVVCSSNGPPFLSPFRRRLPQITYTPSSKWRNVTGRTNLVHAPVHFDYLGYSRQGVPMRELSTRGAHALASMIVGATDQVLVHTGLSRITLYIIVSLSIPYIDFFVKLTPAFIS